MTKKTIFSVVGLVVIWTILVHAPSHWNPILAFPLYPGLVVHSLVIGPRGGTASQEKFGFAAELTANLLAYLLATVMLLRVTRSQ